MKRLKCFIRKLKWKSMGVRWDGHCWNSFVTSDGDRGVTCIDCRKKKIFTEKELEQEKWWND